MAKFKEMRKFVSFVKEEHLNNEIFKKRGQKHYGDGNFDWPCINEARKAYAEYTNNSDIQVEDIIDDCVEFNYLEYGELSLGGLGYPLIVTSKGRHLIMKLGLIRELSKDNSEWLNASVAFIVGVLVAGVSFIIFLLSRK